MATRTQVRLRRTLGSPTQSSVTRARQHTPKQAEAVLQGGKPNFVEIGPFWYRTNISRLEIEFEDDGSSVQTVSFIRRKVYYFNETLSAPWTNENVLITNINAGYVAAVMTAGSELFLMVALST